MNLTIGIPTYNRIDMLDKNLKLLCNYIISNNLEEQVCLLVSDNASTQNVTQLFSKILQQYPQLSIDFHQNEKNIGGIKNILQMLTMCKTKYFLLLGDDDFIDENYLLEVMSILSNDPSTTCIIPSYYNIDLAGEKNGMGRDINKKSRVFKAGFYNCFINSWRGHQLSGLVFYMKDICNILSEKRITNWYPQIYMLSVNCLRGTTYHITEFPVKVTRPPQKDKEWGYGDTGLIDSIFNNYKLLDGINMVERFLLELKVIDAQYWRIAMYLKRGPGAFFKCLKSISASSDSTIMMRILIWVLVPFIFTRKGIQLLFNGTLFKTLSTKVDI